MTNTPNIQKSVLRQLFRLLPVVFLGTWVLITLAESRQWETFAVEIMKLVIFCGGLFVLKKAMPQPMAGAASEAAGRVLQPAFTLLVMLMLLGDAQILATSFKLLPPRHKITESSPKQKNIPPVGGNIESVSARR